MGDTDLLKQCLVFQSDTDKYIQRYDPFFALIKQNDEALWSSFYDCLYNCRSEHADRSRTFKKFMAASVDTEQVAFAIEEKNTLAENSKSRSTSRGRRRICEDCPNTLVVNQDHETKFGYLPRVVLMGSFQKRAITRKSLATHFAPMWIYAETARYVMQNTAEKGSLSSRLNNKISNMLRELPQLN